MKITALAGGVGGAKLAHGLAVSLPPEELAIIVNTGDDFEHWGLKICPDLDTVCYTLADIANPETGWGRKSETWQTYHNVSQLGGTDWFRLGDQDLATHLVRTEQLKNGETLSEITKSFCKTWGIQHLIFPMSNQPIATMVDTVEFGEMAFQEYFVKQKCEPKVKGFRFAGIEQAQPVYQAEQWINGSDAIVFCPSNPWVSIDPILAVFNFRGSPLKKPVVAVSPIIGGESVKGPAAKMYRELNIRPSALAVAEHYQTILHGMVIDTIDEKLKNAIEALGIKVLVTNTIMHTPEDRKRLAKDVLHFTKRILE